MSASSEPLFVVGCPRSGTTLLRNLLNGHPDIALTAHESHFLPWMLRTYGDRTPGAQKLRIGPVLTRFKGGLLYRKGVDQRDFHPSDSALMEALGAEEWIDLVRGVFGLYSEKLVGPNTVWGDKTPSYVDHIDLIATAIPGARFVHIVRDPRDQILSERSIWGKSISRSAFVWDRRIRTARQSGAALDGRYTEVLYEDLATNPESELTRITSWLGLGFDEEMLSTVRESDELGQMIGVTAVRTEAIGGRRLELSQRAERSIATLAGETARSLGYDLPAVQTRKMSKPEYLALAMRDRIGITAYAVRKYGLWEGLRVSLAALKDAGAIR